MMDCLDARKHLSRLMLPLEGESSAELAAAQEHLEHCDGCQAHWEQQAESDRALSHRMTEVEVPVQLADRIRDRIAASAPRPATAGSSPTRRAWMLSAAAAALILIVCAPLVMWTFSSPTITLEKFLTVIDQQEEAADLDSWEAVPQVETPAGWLTVPQLAAPHASRGQRIAGVRLSATRFAFRAMNGQPIRGVLWTIAESSVAGSTELPSLQGAQVHYGRGSEYLIWRESGTVYVVVLNGHGLHDLQDRLLARRTVT